MEQQVNSYFYFLVHCSKQSIFMLVQFVCIGYITFVSVSGIISAYIVLFIQHINNNFNIYVYILFSVFGLVGCSYEPW